MKLPAIFARSRVLWYTSYIMNRIEKISPEHKACLWSTYHCLIVTILGKSVLSYNEVEYGKRDPHYKHLEQFQRTIWLDYLDKWLRNKYAFLDENSFLCFPGRLDFLANPINDHLQNRKEHCTTFSIPWDVIFGPLLTSNFWVSEIQGMKALYCAWHFGLQIFGKVIDPY